MNFIKTLLSDGTGAVSSARFVLLVTVGVILGKSVAFNVMALIHGGTPVAFDPTEVAMLGAAFAGKVVQAFSENKKA